MDVQDFEIKKNKLGQGSFGEVVLGVNRLTNEKVAVKIETTEKKKILKHEYDIYRDLGKNVYAPHIPKIYWFGQYEGANILIMECMQASIEKLHVKCAKKFGLKTTLMIAIQIMDLIKKLHEANYIHRDIKPDNFLLGGTDKSRIYMIDFGLTKKFKNVNNVHIKFLDGKSLVGTARYASINSHSGYELSRRDDLESIFYMFIYLFKGVLPWQGIDTKNRDEKYKLIGNKKKSVTPEELCTDMPPAFATGLKYIKQLGFKDKPNYSYLRGLLTDTFRQQGFTYDCKYDWV
jgi:serine/threonine protein kinase